MSATTQVLPVVDSTTYPPIQGKTSSDPQHGKNNQQKPIHNSTAPKSRGREDKKDAAGIKKCSVF
jgi:hypothetical protein